MPSTSPAQKRLMAAAAHTPGGYGGVPQSVGKDFNEADKGKKFNKGGSVEPSSKEEMFKQNLGNTASNPTGGNVAMKKGGAVKKAGWRRW